MVLDFAQFSPPLLLIFLPLLLFFFITKFLSFESTKNGTKSSPKAYPIIGHLIPLLKHKNVVERFQWILNQIATSPTSTFILHRPFRGPSILTADPATVEHILKTRFANYQKGPYQQNILRDLLGDGIFNADGDTWKFQRQVASHEFNTKSLRKFIETVVETEISDRLIPVLSDAAKNNKVLDLQDVLQRFAFDNICRISFGYDPEYLNPSLPQAKFAVAFEEATMLSAKRFRVVFPIVWKVKRFLNIGSERRVKEASREIWEFANSIVKRKMQEMEKKTEDESEKEVEDLLSRFLKSGHSDEKFVTDIVISFILAGRDTTSAALTWFFWLLHNNKHVEEEILREIQKHGEETEQSVFTEVKEMAYTHAAITESMRLYPPVAVDSKEAAGDDVMPDGTPVKKGMLVTYHPYAMGRVEKLWGPTWPEFRPERWLRREEGEDGEDPRWRFVPRDPYSFPVFQAGPRVCLGKEMAYLQMKRVVGRILRQFRVVPAVEEGFDPVYVPGLTGKMKGGFPVRIEERSKTE